MTDAKLVAGLLMIGPLCLPCIEAKSQVPRSRVGAVLESAERNVRLATRRSKCCACGRIVPTYRLGGARSPWLASS